MEQRRRHVHESRGEFEKLGWVRQSILYEPLEILAEGFEPVKRRPNPASQYNRNLWPPVTCAAKKKCNAGKVAKLFCLNKEDIIDLCYVPRRYTIFREAKQYLVSQLTYRSWEKYGGPAGLEYAKARKAELAANRIARRQAGAAAPVPVPVPAPEPARGNVNLPGPTNGSRRKTTPRKAVSKQPPVQRTLANHLPPNQLPSPGPVDRQEDPDVITGPQVPLNYDSSSDVEIIAERGIRPKTPGPLTPGPTPANHKRGRRAQDVFKPASPTPSAARPIKSPSVLTPSTPSRAFLSPSPSTPVSDATKSGAASLPTPSKTFPSPARRLFQDGGHNSDSQAGPLTPMPKCNLPTANKGTPEREVIEILASDEEDVFSTPRPRSNFPVRTPKSQKNKTKTKNVQLGDVIELSD